MALKKKWLQRSALNEVRKKIVFKSIGLCKGGGGGSGFASNIQSEISDRL